MRDASEMAGFFSAHGIWCVADGETLVPIYAFIDSNGEQQMQRMAHELLEDGVAFGKKKLESPAPGVTRHVLIFDGRIPSNGGKIDALIVEWRSHASENAKVVVAIPYTPASKGGLLKRSKPFAIHKPKLIDISDEWREDISEVFQSFFEGVGRHEKGSVVWDEHLDESK